MVAVLPYTYSEFTSGSRQNDFRHAVADTAGSVRDKVTINHVRSTSTHRRQASRSGIEVDFTVIDALVEALDIDDLNRNLRLRGLREVSDLKPASTTEVSTASDESCIEGNIVNICILVFPIGLMYLGVVSWCKWAPKKREHSVPNVVAGQTAPHLAPVPVSRDMLLERVDDPLQLGCRPPATPADPAVVPLRVLAARNDAPPPPGHPCGPLRQVKLNRGPQGNVGFSLESVVGGAKILHMIPDGPAFNCGQLTAGDVIVSADGTSLADLPLQDIANFLRGPPGSSIILWIHSREDFTVTEAEASDPNVAAAPFDPNVASEPFRTVLDQDQQMKIALEESHKEAQAARIEEDEQVKIALTKSLEEAQAARMATSCGASASEPGVDVLDTGAVFPAVDERKKERERERERERVQKLVFQRADQDAHSEEPSKQVAEGHAEKRYEKKGGAGGREREENILKWGACDMDDDLKQNLLQHRITRQVCWCAYARVQGTVLRVLTVFV